MNEQERRDPDVINKGLCSIAFRRRILTVIIQRIRFIRLHIFGRTIICCTLRIKIELQINRAV